MRNREHLYFDTPASAGDRYFGIGVVASQYAVQMMAPGRIIGFKAYGSSSGEQAIIQDVAPAPFVSGDRISVYISYDAMFEMGFLLIHLNGAYADAGQFQYSWFADVRNENWNATILVEYF